MFGDVGEPELVETHLGEVTFDEVIVHRRTRLARQAAFLRERRPDPFLRTQPGHAVLAGLDALACELVGDEPNARSS
jgi:hypothetical protein